MNRFTVTCLGFVAAAVGACGGGPSSPATDDDPDPPNPGNEITCPALNPATSSGLPTRRIAIGAVPSTFGSPVAAAISNGANDPSGLAFVTEGSSGGLELIVPLHPDAALAGGTVTLTVTDGTRSCEPFQFSIQPLPTAEGELEAIVDLLQDVVDGQAELFGTTRQELVEASVDELPPGLWPLVFVQTILDDPANPRSLRAIAEGGEGAEVLDWMNRILAVTSMREDLTNPPNPQPGTTAPPRNPAPARASAFGCLPSVVGQSAQALSDCMKDQAEAQRRTEGISARVAADIIDAFSTLDEHGLPVAGVVSEIFSWISWLITTERTKAAALYPSTFTGMSLQVDRDRFMEDEDETGKLTFASVTATNLGYNLLNEIIDGIKQAVSLAETTGEFDFSTGTDADEAASEFRERILPIIEQRLRELQLEAFDIQPEPFGPVVVTDRKWIDARLAAGDAITLDEEAITYEPRLFGESTVSVRTADGEFGGDQIAEQVVITVDELMVSISPATTFVAPSDPQNPQFEVFTVEVQDSKYPDMVDLDLTTHPEQGLAEIDVNEDSETHTVNYLAPSAPDYDEEDMIIVEHTATTGARANGPLRRAFATIRFGEIEITSPADCIELGATETFTAEVLGPTDTSVRWSATHGMIDENSGEFTAPSTRPPNGLVTIRAESVEFDGLEDEVVVPVGCTCQATLTIGGSVIAAQPGDQVYFTDWGGATEPYGNDDEFFGVSFRPAAGGWFDVFPLDENPGTWPRVGTGTPVRAQGTVGLSGPEVLFSSDDDFPAIINLTEYVPEMKAAGSVSADITIISTQPPYSTPTTLTFQFAVEVPPGYQRGPPLPPTGYRFSCTVGG